MPKEPLTTEEKLKKERQKNRELNRKYKKIREDSSTKFTELFEKIQLLEENNAALKDQLQSYQESSESIFRDKDEKIREQTSLKDKSNEDLSEMRKERDFLKRVCDRLLDS